MREGFPQRTPARQIRRKKCKSRLFGQKSYQVPTRGVGGGAGREVWSGAVVGPVAQILPLLLLLFLQCISKKEKGATHPRISLWFSSQRYLIPPTYSVLRQSFLDFMHQCISSGCVVWDCFNWTAARLFSVSPNKICSLSELFISPLSKWATFHSVPWDTFCLN